MKKRTIPILWLIIVLSVLIRTVAAIAMGDQIEILPGTADQLSYHTLALQVLSGRGFSFPEAWWPLTQPGAPTAHWSFLYTAYLTLVYGVFGPHPLVARIIQAVVVGILHPMLAYLIGKRVFHHQAGLVAAGLTSVYAYFIYYSAALMTEPFYITGILLVLYTSICIVDQLESSANSALRMYGLALALGLVLAGTVYLRQLFILFVPFLFLWVFYRLRFRSLPVIVILTAILMVSIVPATLYNYSRFGRFVLLNTNSGFAFFWGNHPIHGTHFIPILDEGDYLKLVPLELRSLDEAALDQELLRLAFDNIRNDFWRYILLSVSRIPAYFIFWPSADSGLISNLTRVASFGISLPFMIVGIFLAVWKKRLPELLHSPVFLLLLFCVVYTGIHLLSWALVRYRLPVDAILIIFAGLPIWEVIRRIWVRTY